MKVIQSQLFGQKFITAHDKNARLFQIRQLLNQHRDLLINNLLKDIPYYLAFKYQAYATEPEVEVIKSKLIEMKRRDVDLVNYVSIINQIKKKAKVKIDNQEFYKEIDQLLIG
jgi:hypothetical protein